LLGPTNGAQRASLRGSRAPNANRSRILVSAALSAALLSSLIALPAAASARITVRIPTQVTPQVTFAPGYWLPEEMYYFDLLNCTRTGGWVQTDGTCKGRGSGRYSTYVAPFWYPERFSTTVPRPYAQLLATRNVCSHFYRTTPLQRMRAAGYPTITNWGENIGCRTTRNTRAAVLASHLFFQSEKSTNGGHWRNIKNSAFRWAGVGVWKYGSRVRLVTDFYH
jgi:hypothetical protein